MLVASHLISSLSLHLVPLSTSTKLPDMRADSRDETCGEEPAGEGIDDEDEEEEEVEERAGNDEEKVEDVDDNDDR